MPNVEFNAYNVLTLNGVMTTPKIESNWAIEQSKEINHNSPVNNIGHSNNISTH